MKADRFSKLNFLDRLCSENSLTILKSKISLDIKHFIPCSYQKRSEWNYRRLQSYKTYTALPKDSLYDQ